MAMLEGGYDERQIKGVFRAVRNGDLQRLQQYFHQGFPVEAADEFGETLLIKSAFSGQIEVVKFLISQGANVNASDWRLRQTPVIRAARIGDYRILDALMEKGPHLNSVDHQMHTALMKASANGHSACVNLLTRAGAMLNAVDRSGMTALMKAAYIGNLATLTILISSGASLDLMDSNGNTALKIAVGRGNLHCVRFLLHHGANVCARDVLVKVVINWYAGVVSDRERFLRDLGCVRMLVEHGAFINVPDNMGNTLLMRAAAVGFLECVLFLSEQPDLNVNLNNDAGETALMIAAKNGHVDILHTCLMRGARENMVDMCGYTAIMHAAYYNWPMCVEILAIHHADTNVLDTFRWTPLMYMAYKGHLHCVNRLIRHGALVDQRNARGDTAFDLAQSTNCHEIMRVLERALDV